MTNSTKNQLIIFGFVIVFIAIVAAVLSAKKKPTASVAPATDPATTPATTGNKKISPVDNTAPASTPALDYNKVLSYGSNGAEVSALQAAYNASSRVTKKLAVDGQFGPGTQTAVIQIMGIGVFSTSLKAFQDKLNAAAAGSTFLGFFGW